MKQTPPKNKKGGTTKPKKERADKYETKLGVKTNSLTELLSALVPKKKP